MLKIALFCSGSGSNAENIIRYFSNNQQIEFPIIVTNKETAFVHERAKKLGVDSVTFSREQFNDGQSIIALLQEYGITHIVLAGFLLKIAPALIEAFPNRIINIHPALLPKFGGKGMYGMHVHEAVVASKETESGITIHYVNENYDEGNIIFQAKCSVTPADNAEDVAHKVHSLEYEHFPKVIEAIWVRNA